jgi:hypothetical protein
MVIAIVALVISAIGTIYAYLQYKQNEKSRQEEKSQADRIQAEEQKIQVEGLREQRVLPEIYNMGGTPGPIRISGSQHSSSSADLWGLVTVVNPTQQHMKIASHHLVINGKEWEYEKVAFYVRQNLRNRSDRISMMGNHKEDYELHIFFSENHYPQSVTGELWLTSSNRHDEPFSVSLVFI